MAFNSQEIENKKIGIAGLKLPSAISWKENHIHNGTTTIEKVIRERQSENVF